MRIVLLFILFQILFINSSYPNIKDNVFCDVLSEELVNEGFENIIIKIVEGELLLTYENRIFRDEVKAIEKINGIIYGDIQNKQQLFDTIILLPQNRNIPLVRIQFTVNDLINFYENRITSVQFSDELKISFDVDKTWSVLSEVLPDNVSTNRFECVISPGLKSELDEFGDPVKLQIDIVPSLRVSPGKGLMIKGEYIFPVVHRDFDVGDPVDACRPGEMSINQVIRFPESIFFSASAGLFSDNRYGFDMELRKYFFGDIFNCGVNIGYTGEARYYEGKYKTGLIDDLSYYVDSEVRVPWYNITISVNYGQYLNEDKGFRVDLKREFNETEIGFFYTHTSSNLLGGLSTGGFNIAIPLFPDKYSKPGFIRLRPAEYFKWEYSYKHFIYFHQKKYSTGYELKNFIKRLNIDYIREQIKNSYLDKN